MDSKSVNTLVVLLGPTGIGKTDLSLWLAQELGSEILSCDSRQMYRELKIGTAVPNEKQLASVKHHFIGNLSIHDYYSAGEFELETLNLLQRIFKTMSIAIMTGGSGLYIDAVVKGIDDLPTIDPTVRAKYFELWQANGLNWLKQKVLEVDPIFYEQTDVSNAKRLLKALEIYEMTGKQYSTLRTESVKNRPFKIVVIGLMRNREELYQRINQRVDIMISDGLVEEALQFYPYKDLNALNTVGYKELFGYFDNTYDLSEAIRLIKRNSRRYAKRQITYWNRDKSITWFHPDNKDEILHHILSV